MEVPRESDLVWRASMNRDLTEPCPGSHSREGYSYENSTEPVHGMRGDNVHSVTGDQETEAALIVDETFRHIRPNLP